MTEILQDPICVYATSFVLFWVLVYVFLRKPVFCWLDDQIAKISSELTTARALRAEAEAALTECKVKQTKAEQEAVQILNIAKGQAENMRKQAEIDIAADLERQKHAATERIRMAEEKAIAAVRDQAVKIGMDLARKNLASKISETDAQNLIDSAIEDVALLNPGRGKKAS